MGETKLTFKRYEKKYLLSAESYRRLMACMAEYIEPDDYHRSTVCSIYYDRDDFRLIRHSIDAPIYKEKLRVRCYNPVGEDSEAFVELKKKYKGIVYKRRVVMTGGVAQNKGIVSALEESLGHIIYTSPLTQYVGALGAALFAYQKALKMRQ